MLGALGRNDWQSPAPGDQGAAWEGPAGPAAGTIPGRLQAQRRGRVQTREKLLQEVWGYDNIIDTRTVDTHIVRIRQKLEPVPEEPRYFLTVHGVGYKFVG